MASKVVGLLIGKLRCCITYMFYITGISRNMGLESWDSIFNVFFLGAGVVGNWRHSEGLLKTYSLIVSTFSTWVARIQLLLLPLSQAWLVLWLVGTINESSQWRWHHDSGSLETCQKHCFQIFFLSAKNCTLLRLARRDRAGNILWKNQMNPPKFFFFFYTYPTPPLLVSEKILI